MCISLGGAARFSGHNVASVAEIFAARLPTNMQQNMQEIRNLKFGLLCFSSPLPSILLVTQSRWHSVKNILVAKLNK